MHNDEPTLLDRLDRRPLITEVADAIANCTPPQVLGVHGDWGLGKTSFMHQLQWHLTGDCPQQPDHNRRSLRASGPLSPLTDLYRTTIRAVWFDAWRYQYETAPVVALLQEIRAQLSWGRQLATATKRNAQVAVRGALLSIEDLTKKIGLQYSKLRDAHREWEVTNLAVALPSHTLRVHLTAEITKLLPRRRQHAPLPRLVVFIDDLDRCEPEAAYRLLEGLKIYLTLDNCVFVLGLNQKVLEAAIASRLSTPSRDDLSDQHVHSRAAAYLEKLCQNVWRLPPVRHPGQLLCDLIEYTVHNVTQRTWLQSAIQSHPSFPPNPRRLKGLANVIGRLAPHLPPAHILPEAAAIVESRLLLIVAYIYQFHHELFTRWQSDLTLYARIRDRCSGDESDIPCLNSLVLPQKNVPDDRTPTPTTGRANTYPDPTALDVFWIQPLVDALGTEVTAEQFAPYLHGRTT